MSFSCVAGGWRRVALVAGLAGLTLTSLASTSAEARRHSHRVRHASAHGSYAPPFSAMVVDARSGRTMYAVAADEPRHPASITKVMTLYLLFEQVQRGNLSLESELTVSRRASTMAPSKLGLRPGETISVDDAIKAIVTRSANDVAAVIAENIAGSEEAFAERMTRKARQLGMSRTLYRNASGLPNPEQITTAHDLTVLARAIQEKFPRLYRYFQTRSFQYAGRTIGNHNHLLGKVEGVDGIKTGFTNASGFNLMTSARLDGRHVVGVVLGGRSAASRDAIMTGLIRDNLAHAATVGKASVLADAADDDGEAPARARLADADVEPVAEPATTGAIAPPPARPVLTALAYAAPAEAETAPVAHPAGNLGKIDARLPFAPAVPRQAEARTRSAAAEPVVVPPRPEPLRARAEASREVAPAPKTVTTRAVTVSPWVIQLAAEDNEGKAKDLLEEARSRSGRVLARAEPFTEKVVRGSATLYRARFSGFTEADDAQEACKALKRNGFACFATRS